MPDPWSQVIDGWTMVVYGNLFLDTVFQADMGPYLGDWPLMAPAVMDLPDDGEGFSFWWVLFMLALPNPAAPADAAAVGDGSYPTQLFFAQRYGNTLAGSYEYGWVAAQGGASQPNGAEAPPADYHLYVIASNLPSRAPGAYTPARYSALGAAAAYTEAGGWSDWQPAFTIERPALLCTAGGRLMETPNNYPAAQFRQNATSSGADGGNHATPRGVEDISSHYPPPWVDVLAWAEAAGWPGLLAHLNDPAWQIEGTGGWGFVEIFNQYTNFFGPGLYSLTTWSWISAYQPRDGWQAQTNPVGPPETIDWVKGVDYADPPFGLYPNYGGAAPPAYDLVGYGAMYGIGFPGHPDGFDHEAPKAIPEWVDVEAYIVPNAYPGASSPEVSVRNAGDELFVEQHSASVDVFIGSPPLYVLGSGVEYSLATELDTPDALVYRSEPGWIDPVGSGMALVDQWQMDWNAAGINNDYGYGTISAPRAVPVAFGEHVAYGTELITIVMQLSAATSQVLESSMVSELPLPSQPHFLDFHATGCQSAPFMVKNYGCYITDPYAPLRDGVPRMGIPTRMHEPRWRYWRPNKIVATELSQIPMRLVQRGDGLGPSPAARLGAGHASASQQSPATRRLGGRNTFE